MVLGSQLVACLLDCHGRCVCALRNESWGATSREASYLEAGECMPLFRSLAYGGHPKAHLSERIWHMPKSVSLWSALPGATPATRGFCFLWNFNNHHDQQKTMMLHAPYDTSMDAPHQGESNAGLIENFRFLYATQSRFFDCDSSKGVRGG